MAYWVDDLKRQQAGKLSNEGYLDQCRKIGKEYERQAHNLRIKSAMLRDDAGRIRVSPLLISPQKERLLADADELDKQAAKIDAIAMPLLEGKVRMTRADASNPEYMRRIGPLVSAAYERKALINTDSQGDQ